MTAEGPPAGDAACPLCGRPLPADPTVSADGTQFCSTGCHSVHATLDPVDERAGEPTSSTGEGTSTDAAARTFLRVDGMYSATCESFLEAVAEKQPGVVDAEASYVTETVRVDHDPARCSETALRDALSTLGYTAYLRENVADADDDAEAGATRRDREMTGLRKRRDDDLLGFRYAAGVLFGAFLLVPYAAILYPTYLAGIVDSQLLALFDRAITFDSGGGFIFVRLYLLLTGIVLFFTGMPVLRGAYISLKMRQPNTDLLVAFTVGGAYVYSTAAALLGRSDIFYDLTVVVAAAVTGAAFYETAVKQRALDRLTDLTVSHVGTARVFGADGTTTEVPVEDVEADDRVLVRQGERIPVDGVLAEGECTVDEAVVTGESLPVAKTAGDDVVGGSVVTDGAAVVRVGDHPTSSIERITTAVWDLQSADHGVQRRADRLSTWVAPVVLAAAGLAGVATIVLGRGPGAALLVSLGVFLVASPWVLGLATPLSVATSLRAALDRGVVVFDETVFERLRDVDVVVFDKTGTLTTGEMDVVDADAPPDLLDAVARLERRASHPAAGAIVRAFGDDGAGNAGDRAVADGGATDRVRDFRSHATGVEGTVDGATVLVGTLDLFAERGWTVDDDIAARAEDARGFGRLPVVVGRDGAAEGLVVVGDEPRAGWDETVERLGDRGASVVVLTGDDPEATDFFRDHDAVTHVFAGVPPAGKTETIRRLGADGDVAMVGDGTNDAPALAAADLGVSLGGGTALAADAADVAIVDDDISAVETAFEVASAARDRVRQNNWLALGYNAVAVPAAVAGLLNPLTAAAAVVVGGGLVAANCARDLRE